MNSLSSSSRRLAVVIPVHNAEPYLKETLRSLVQQTRTPDEVVIIDDQSSDHSLRIAESFQRQHPNICRTYAHKVGSAAITRQVGADLTSTELIMFLDADDVLEPETLEGLASALRHQAAAVAICPWNRWQKQEGSWQRAAASCRRWNEHYDALGNWLRGWYHPTSSVLWTRQAFVQTGGWDPRATVNDDGDLMMRALVSGIPLQRASAGMVLYRRIPGELGSLSDRRRAPYGLEGRLWTIVKLGYWLRQRERLAEYRQPIGEALLQIRADAAGISDAKLRRGFISRIDQCYGRYGPATPMSLTRGRHLASRFGEAINNAVGSLWTTGLSSNASSMLGDRRAANRHSRDKPYADPAFDGSCHRSESEPARSLVASVSTPARPLVTVIIPTFNRATTLGRAIASVLRQTCEDFELLIVDDGSTDDTQELIEQITDSRIQYLPQPQNLGVSAARNRGLQQARGDFIAFLDSDDEWLADKLELQLACFRQSSEELGLVYTAYQFPSANGDWIANRPSLRGDAYRALLSANGVEGGGSNVMIRRSVISAVGYFDERLPAIEDYDYWLRVSRFYKIDFVPIVLLRYHAPPAGPRKSTEVESNLTARQQFFRKHQQEMQLERVAHDYLLNSAGRYLVGPNADRSAARCLAKRAVCCHFSPRTAAYLLLYTLLPTGMLVRLRDNRQRNRLDRMIHRNQPSVGHKRVMLFTAVLQHPQGGVAGVFARLSSQLGSHGFQVTESWGALQETRVKRVRAASGPSEGSIVSRLLEGLSSVVSGIQLLGKLALMLARSRPDIVNVHFIHARTVQLFVWLRPLFGYQLVLSAHGSDIFSPPAGNATWLPRVLAKADQILAVTPRLAERIVEFPNVNRDRVRTIPNGVDLEFWAPPLQTADNATSSVARVVTVGQLRGIKGQDILLRAWPAVLKKYPRARLAIVGEGDRKAKLRTLAKNLGITHSVEFTGQLAPLRIRELLHQATLFVLPSRSEAMPLALMEAMACGVPVIATRVGGVAELLADNAGVVIEPEDISALSESLILLLNDPARRRELAGFAKQRIAEHDCARMVAAYAQVFQQLTNPQH